MQYIYLIDCRGFKKIGVANDVQSRLAGLQTGNPFPLALHACYGFENAEVVEKALHQKFSSARERGEWFLLSELEIDSFHKLCTMLGGETYVLLSDVSESQVRDAEAIQEIFLDDPNIRIEKRIENGEVRGFALRQRNKERKVISYIGKRANPEEFQKMMDSIAGEQK